MCVLILYTLYLVINSIRRFDIVSALLNAINNTIVIKYCMYCSTTLISDSFAPSLRHRAKHNNSL